MKKITTFRNVYSNLLIVLSLLLVLSLTIVSSTTTAFTTASYDPIYSGSKDHNAVSFLINVYQNPDSSIEKILDILERKNIKATFFVGGCWVEKNENLVQNIIEKGHEIGNHGYFHRNHSNLTSDRNREEIVSCHNLIKENFDVRMTLFAPPSGAFSKSTLITAEEEGYKTILWSKDTIDWRDQDETIIINRATKKIKSGDFILMHPTTATVSALEKIIEIIERENLKILTVGENI